ncbi:hypothetical protein JTB14_007693 [Gonioctena quinquepunctata]|nr:hypothetical protein JTB14_007693 [Gonioctena quinquepunctata]
MPEFREEQFEPDTSVISGFPDVFTESIREPVTKASVHRIRVKEEKPFREMRYGKLSEERKKIVHDEIRRLLQAGGIVPSTSEYCSTVLLVPKKNGTLRFCDNYRDISKLIIPEAPNSPPIQETVRELRDVKIFSALDLKNGFWQAPSHKESRKYTAFEAPGKKWSCSYSKIDDFSFIRINFVKSTWTM